MQWIAIALAVTALVIVADIAAQYPAAPDYSGLAIGVTR